MLWGLPWTISRSLSKPGPSLSEGTAWAQSRGSHTTQGKCPQWASTLD